MQSNPVTATAEPGPITITLSRFHLKLFIFQVFQRRFDGSVNFYRTWLEYEDGFGNLKGEFWLGNRFISQYTSGKSNFTLKVIAVAFDLKRASGYLYDFKVAGGSLNYMIMYSSSIITTVIIFSSACFIQNNQSFSTWDRDNDGLQTNCAMYYKGAWWYYDCHFSNFNGFYYAGGYHSSFADGLDWLQFKGYYESMRMTWMMIMKSG
ncbi:hypothetical protein HELRODRAFT_91190 [Helobdella robusta]|uniref:Fibrinogen C-terminal domain-containing protein n=1 Tax=Helobdella robusta TaxID=6412 RepID=T1G810_HELRO|nr:hypothetical protein HELRODRAFT_91190 [Helobdella robusta]ESN89954.1 hypothetical protein HELRODRAFT_91190 [Helobdella robusta]